MKQLIVMLVMVVLGIAIFNLIAGDEGHSILNVMKDVWEEEIQIRTNYP
ncbi:MAG: hypothetical protein GX076_04525 [Clostridiales bacterium]|nr:hypothetical protein [Clostridiales bacterium]